MAHAPTSWRARMPATAASYVEQTARAPMPGALPLVPRQIRSSSQAYQLSSQRSWRSRHSQQRVASIPANQLTVAFAAPASLPREHVDSFSAFNYLEDLGVGNRAALGPMPMPRNVEGPADDPQRANPLLRQEMLGTGWMGVILEFEGIAVEDFSDLHTRAWQQLAKEEGKPQPFQWALRRAEGMKNEQVVQEVLLWSRNPMEVRRLCARKEELFREFAGDVVPAMLPGTAVLLDILAKHKVPVALACSAPEARVRPVLEALGLSERLDAVITAEDVARGRPDPEAILYAAQQLGRPPIRCVLIGNSNASVEAARECGMAVVAVAGRTPVYELTAADLVVRSLDELSFVNLKQLFRDEQRVAHELDPEMEEEPEQKHRSAPTITMDRW